MHWDAVRVYIQQAFGVAGLVAVGWIITHWRTAARALEEWDETQKRNRGFYRTKLQREWAIVFTPTALFLLTFFLFFVSLVLISGFGDAMFYETFVTGPEHKTTPVYVEGDDGLWRER